MEDFKFGWNKEKEDRRDFLFKLENLQPIKSVYLAHNNRFPLAYDQGDLGSCTAQAVGFLVHYNLLNGHMDTSSPIFRPSRLFIYYNERVLENTVNIDAGAYLRDGIKAVSEWGAPSEDLWEYNIDNFAVKPPQKSYTQGLKLQSLRYEKVNNTDKLMLVNALMRGFPICFGMYAFSSFLSLQVAKTGIVPMPSGNDYIVGGHAMVIVGYRELDDTFIVRNSWGEYWGQKGYCRIPAKYITNPYYCSDFWIITRME